MPESIDSYLDQVYAERKKVEPGIPTGGISDLQSVAPESAAPESIDSYLDRVYTERKEVKKVEVPTEEQGFFGNLTDVAFSGIIDTKAGLQVSDDVAMGSFDDNTAKIISEQLTRAKPAPPALVEAKEDISTAAQGISEAEGFIDTTIAVAKTGGAILGEAITNPAGLAYFTAEQAANMAPSLAGMYVGGKAGGALGAVVGAPTGLGALVTAPIGATIGALSGAFLGALPTEAGMEFIGRVGNKLNELGIEPTEENISAFLTDQELVGPILGEARRKAVATAAVDAPLTLLGGRVATSPARTALKQATKTAAAGATKAEIAATAKTLLKQTSKLKRAGYIAAGVGVEAGSEGVSEAAGQLAATGEVDPVDIALEMFGGLGGSIASLPTSIAALSNKKPEILRNRKLAPKVIAEIEKLGDFAPKMTAAGWVEMTETQPTEEGTAEVKVKLPPKQALIRAKVLGGLALNKEETAKKEGFLNLVQEEATALTEIIDNPDTLPEVRDNTIRSLTQINILLKQLGAQVKEVEAEIPLTREEVAQGAAEEIALLQKNITKLGSSLRDGTGSPSVITPMLVKAREDLAAAQVLQAKQAVEDLNISVNKHLSESPEKLVFEAEYANPPAVMKDFIDIVNSKFAKQVVFYKTKKGTWSPRGVASPGSPNITFINIDEMGAPHLFIVGHELLHLLRTDASNIYDELLVEAQKAINTKHFADKKAFIKAAFKRRGRKFTGESLTDKANEELVADALGAMLLDPEFWNELMVDNPSLFEKLMAKLIQIIQRFGVYKHFDIIELRSAMATALKKYAALQESKTAIDQEFGVPEDMKFSEPTKEAVQKSDSNSKKTMAQNVAAIKAAVKSGEIFKSSWYKSLPAVLSTMPLFHKVEIFKDLIGSLPEIARLEREHTNIQDGLLSTSQELVNEAIKLCSKGSDLHQTFMLLMNTASLFEVYPDSLEKTMQEWTQEAWEQNEMPKITEQLTPQAAWKVANGLYKKLEKQSIKTKYLEIIATMKSLHDRERNNMLGRIQGMEEYAPIQAAELRAEYEKAYQTKKGAYSPLGRFGSWMVTVYTENGKVLHHETADSHYKVEALRKSLLSIYPEAAIVIDKKEETLVTKDTLPVAIRNNIEVAVDARFAPPKGASLEHAAELEEQREGFKADMYEMWLRSLPEGSFRRSNARRKGVLGFNTNAFRSFVDYTAKAASSIAYAEKGIRIDELIAIEKQELRESKKAGEVEDVSLIHLVLNNVQNHIQSARVRKTSPVAQVLGKMTASWYLTSPSQFLLQMSQVGIITLPKLAAKFGARKATAALTRALHKSMTPKTYSPRAIHSIDPFFLELSGSYSEAEYNVARKQAIQEKNDSTARPTFMIGEVKYRAEEQLEMINNILDHIDEASLPEETQTHLKRLGTEKKKTAYLQELLALRMAEARNLLNITLSHQAMDLIGGKDKAGLLHHMMFFIREGELVSRKSAILAAMDVARAAGKDFIEAFEYADFVNLDTLFDFSTSGKPTILRSNDVISSATMFQTFRVNAAWKILRLMTQSLKRRPADFAKLSKEEQQAFEAKRNEMRKEFTGVLSMLVIMGGFAGLPMFSMIMALVSIAAGDDDEPFLTEHELYNGIKAATNKQLADVLLYGVPSIFGAQASTRVGLDKIFEPSVLDAPEWLEGSALSNWMAAQLMGPAWGIVTSFSRSVELNRKGEHFKALEAALPKGIKDGLKAYRMATDGIKDSRGRRLLDDSQLNIAEYILMAGGINPYDLALVQTETRQLSKLKTKIGARKSELLRAFDRSIEDEDTMATEEIYRQIVEFSKKNPASIIKASDLSGVVRRSLLKDKGYLTTKDLYLVRKEGFENIYREESQR